MAREHWIPDGDGGRKPSPALEALVEWTQGDYGDASEALDAVEPILRQQTLEEAQDALEPIVAFDDWGKVYLALDDLKEATG